jgi:glycosyltransferase involved in cell wall biosynthesis
VLPLTEPLRDSRLLIAIPTFDRALRLRATLEALAPQLTVNTFVLVIDNHSEDDTPVVCEEFRARFPHNVAVRRNSVNVGACPNTMKCFEAADDGWLWILPDDDEILPNAVTLITSAIQRHRNAAFINFSTSLLTAHGVTRSQETISRGIDDFLAACDSFGNILFLTATIYNCIALKGVLRTAYHSLNTFAPQVAVQLTSLTKDGAIAVQTNVSIANWGTRVEWSNIAVSDGVAGLLKYVPSAAGRRSLNCLIEREFPFAARSRSRLSAALNAVAEGPSTLSDRIAKCGNVTAFTGRYRLHLVLLLLLQWLDKAHLGRGIRAVRASLDKLRGHKIRGTNDGAFEHFEQCDRL